AERPELQRVPVHGHERDQGVRQGRLAGRRTAWKGPPSGGPFRSLGDLDFLDVHRTLAVLGAALVIASPAASAGGLAKVWIADESPLVVRGSGFHASSKMSIVVSKARRSYNMTATSTAAGGFTARFTSSLTSACGNTLVTARDAGGALAISRTVMNDCGGIRVPPPR